MNRFDPITFFDDRNAEMLAAACLAAQGSITEHIIVSGPHGSGKLDVATVLQKTCPVTCNGQFRVYQCRKTDNKTSGLLTVFFGADPGSFPPGTNDLKQGLVDFVAGGVLCLDEIHELPVEVLAHLCNVVETSRFMRFGGNQYINLGCRLILTTSLSEERWSESPKGEVFARLAGLVKHKVKIPGLVEDKKQIVPLATCLLPRDTKIAFSPEAESILTDLPWTGGVKELKNTVERVVWQKMLGVNDGIISQSDLQSVIGTRM